MKIRIQDVLDLSGLDPDEWSLYTTGHFDFVVSQSVDDVPAFALEIDGLSHTSPRQINLDILKNRLCARADFPLLRLGVDAIDRREEVTVLEWLVQRFVTWEEQNAKYREDPLSPLVHSIVFPYPGNLDAAVRLFNNHQVGITLRDASALAQLPVFQRHWLVKASQDFEGKTRYAAEVSWPDGLPQLEKDRTSENVIAQIGVRLRDHRGSELFRTMGRASFAWAHKTRQGVTPDHALIPSLEEMQTLGIHAPRLPWLDASLIAEELALYRALGEVEQWVARSLPRRPHVPTIRR